LRHRLLVIALLAVLGATAAPSLAATQVGYPVLLREIRSGPLIRAVINRYRGDIEIKFQNLSEWEAFYPPGAQPGLQRLLRARHIRVIFATRPKVKAKPKAVHHHLRYIVAGVLIAVAVIVALAFLYDRRRRTQPALGSDPPPA
jgi:anti-sigma-K factor RskA